MSDSKRPLAKGRGSQLNPPNRFGEPYYEADLEYVEHDPDSLTDLHNLKTEYFPDDSRTIVAENDSPDVGFRYSINPYRGCSHGCSYCYARPTHEYLGLNAGLDFETKIYVKERAPELFREFLAQDSWSPAPIAFSGVTDCYQPAERRYALTRGCLAVARDARQPILIITKNALIVRDLDILKELAIHNLVRVSLSVTTLDAQLARSMEPRTSIPSARLGAMKSLAEAGIPVQVLIAPVIPGLNDNEIPAILAAAKEAGASAAGYVLLRLPWTVAPVFNEWLERTQPTRAKRILSRIMATRDGKMNDPRFGVRMCGVGELADQIAGVFRLFARKYQLDGDLPPLDCTQFRPPTPESGQRRLF
jgi:DNA repair photolyase